VIAMVILMATFFWAMWDEDFGQRPWKAFQHEWKDRLLDILEDRSLAVWRHAKRSRKQFRLPEAETRLRSCHQKRAPRIKEINERLRDLSAQILAVQNVFTDRRAYVSASTYDIETETSASAKQRKRRNLRRVQEGKHRRGNAGRQRKRPLRTTTSLKKHTTT